MTVVLLLLVGLGGVLYFSIGESRQFRITPPPTATLSKAAVSTISRTTVTSLTTLDTQAVLESPRYTGTDAGRRHWEVTGDKATQYGSAASGTYVLEQPRAIWEDPSQTTPFALAATRGVYTPATNDLVLQGEVSMAGMNMSLKSPQMLLNVVSRTLVTQNDSERVEMTGTYAKGSATVTADSLQVDGIQRTLHMRGRVHAVMEPHDNTPAAK
jgi:LPS export ABC transporter protein LptC